MRDDLEEVERSVRKPSRHADVNAVVGGYLRDLAFAQPTQPKMFGYKRAAAAVFALETLLTELIADDGRFPGLLASAPVRRESFAKFSRLAARRRSTRR